MLNVARSARSFRSNTPDRSRVTIASRKRLEDEEDTSYWRSATFGVLLTSAILATLVALMCFQVDKLSKQAESHKDVMELQIIILTEILRQLQIGKAINCSVCKMQWLQHKDSCYLFRERKMGWRSSMGFCRDEFSSLAVIHNDTEQMNFLRFESKKHFRQRHGKSQYYKFWMGLTYDIVTKQWKWADGSLYDPKILQWYFGPQSVPGVRLPPETIQKPRRDFRLAAGNFCTQVEATSDVRLPKIVRKPEHLLAVFRSRFVQQISRLRIKAWKAAAQGLRLPPKRIAFLPGV